ncbi:MAG TPA: hypothetical protein VD866_29495 [Urbifossiella sp.]|nr:hypothetical protein [Urbifossiella sp.]
MINRLLDLYRGWPTGGRVAFWIAMLFGPVVEFWPPAVAVAAVLAVGGAVDGVRAAWASLGTAEVPARAFYPALAGLGLSVLTFLAGMASTPKQVPGIVLFLSLVLIPVLGVVTRGAWRAKRDGRSTDELIAELNKRYGVERKRLKDSLMDDVTKGMALEELHALYVDAMAQLTNVR